MIDLEALRRLKGLRIYQFFLDEKTGEIIDITSRDDFVKVVRCKDCHWHYGTICRRNNTMFWNDDGFCSYAEREEYETD